MLKIGLTGGIGSGKTMISNIFLKLGVPIFNSDFEAKKCIHENNSLKNKLKNIYGDEIYMNGEIQSKKIAKIIFSNSKKLKELNSLIHPYVNISYKNWLKNQSSKYIIKESAILFESNTNKKLDFIICVSANDSLRVSRVIKRDNISSEKVRLIMNNQLEQKQKIALSDFHISNDDELLIPQVLKLHNHFLEISNIKS